MITIAQPQVTWRGTNNCYTGRVDPDNEAAGPQTVQAIVCHVMQGTIESADGWFRNPASTVSAHFGVARDGRIYQWVKLSDTAWGNGIWQDPDLSIPILADLYARKINPNAATIAIEHEGLSGQPFDPRQIAATIALQTWLCARFGITPDANHIFGHNRIEAHDRAHCPGATYPFGDIRDHIAVALKGISAHSLPPMNPIPAVPSPDWEDAVLHYWVIGAFATFWKEHGGLPFFGRPLGGMTASDPAFPGLTIQWFERARFEQLPDGTIQLGRVGAEALSARQSAPKTTP